MTIGIWAILGGLLTPAVAQDFDELDDFEFDEPATPPERTDADEVDPEPAEEEADDSEPELVPAEPEAFDDETLLDFEDEEDVDLLEDDPDEKIEGDDDTEADFREMMRQVAEMAPDAGIQEWEAYLERYPKTLYRQEIEAQIEQLFDQLYADGQRVPRGEDDGPVDAIRQELDFSQGLFLDNINPRQRIQVGFGFGAPSYVDFIADYEHQFARRVSVHGGMRRRFSGFGFEVGPRFALVKSAKTQTLLTFSLDARVVTNPVYPTFRPMLGFGKTFGAVQIQAQAGADLEIRDFSTETIPRTELQARITGGAQIQWAASDRVAVFAETQLLLKPDVQDGQFDGGVFSFNVVALGLTFYPSVNQKDPEARNLEAKVGGSLPVAQQYYDFFLGSLNGQANYFL